MKIYAISDFHISTNTNKPMDVFGGNWVGYLDKIRENWQSTVREEDVVLIAGDLSWAMDAEEAQKDLAYFNDLKGVKVFVKGNHDLWWSGINKVRDILPANGYAVYCDSFRTEGLTVGGSRGWTVPASPEFKAAADEKIYRREAERLRLSLKSAKAQLKDGDKFIAMIHFPPFSVNREDTLYTALFEEYGVQAVVYGHLHGKYARADRIIERNGIKYYLTSCDMVNNTLTEIEV